MNKLYLMAKGHTQRFPNGNEPYQIVARILEECGEVASEVNRFENSGVKFQKHGYGSKEDLANEIRQAIMCLVQLSQYYKCEGELEHSIEVSLERLKEDGII